jgi:hypothetical protein
MNVFKTPQSQNVAFLLAAFGLAASFTPSLFGQAFARPDGSVPVPID